MACMPTSDILITSAAVEYQFDSNRSICSNPQWLSDYCIYAQASMITRCDRAECCYGWSVCAR